jgi:pyruvate/2-oxoglutarate dehydrogenase complex dihydrolipoamide dehydrogenase (E3) component
VKIVADKKYDEILGVHIIAAHLSQQNNTPALARTALATALGCVPDWIGIADQALGFAWREM